MRLKLSAVTLFVTLVVGQIAVAIPLYSEDFEVNPTALWLTNNNGLGTNAANFFFDYDSLGIPLAPHSSGATTRGLKIGSNLNPATAPASGIPGISVSPTGQSFTGDYELRFDWWQNYFGPLSTGGVGSTMLSTFGVLTSGTSANYAGAADSVFFGATGEGGTTADFRILSSQNQSISGHPIPDPGGYAVYPAGSQNASAPLYQSTFPAGNSAPFIQQTNFPASQFGTTPAGGTGFSWHDVTITKLGSTVRWKVDGVLLGSVDTAGFTTPTSGTNILFGSSDINSTTNASPDFAALAFTLIDNVRVTELTGGFIGYFDPANWITTTSGQGGQVDTSGAPYSIAIVGPDDQSGVNGNISYSILAPNSGIFSFDWLYNSVDVPGYDTGYYINNAFISLSNADGEEGHVSVPVNAGDTIGWGVASSDSLLGAGVLTVSNFSMTIPEPNSALIALIAIALIAAARPKMNNRCLSVYSR